MNGGFERMALGVFIRFSLSGCPAQVWTYLGGDCSPAMSRTQIWWLHGRSSRLLALQAFPGRCARIWTGLHAGSGRAVQALLSSASASFWAWGDLSSVICSSLVLGFVSFLKKFQSGLFYKGCVGGKSSE